VIDLHTHHDRCGHAEGTLASMARAAAEAGVSVFGWSDHAPLFAHELDHPKPRTQMARSQWAGYLEEACAVRTALRTELPGLDLRIGVEADYLPGTEAVYREALAANALDYALGSVHEVEGWHIYKPRTWDSLDDPDAFHRGYWRAVRAAAGSGLFDVLSHLDAIKAMAPAARSAMGAEIEQALDAIADSGVAVEINGSGLRKAGELFPGPALLEGLVRREVPVTIGSDAHRAAEVGAGYREAAAQLRALGRTRIVTFCHREPVWVPLD
jgi:histidinol-phosphatase (PHP family)